MSTSVRGRGWNLLDCRRLPVVRRLGPRQVIHRGLRFRPVVETTDLMRADDLGPWFTIHRWWSMVQSKTQPRQIGFLFSRLQAAFSPQAITSYTLKKTFIWLRYCIFWRFLSCHSHGFSSPRQPRRAGQPATPIGPEDRARAIQRWSLNRWPSATCHPAPMM
jgi:hypothetical protein